MQKICFLSNIAPSYVEASYVLFDKELNIKWFFGTNDTNIREMNYALLNDVSFLKTIRLIKPAYWLLGSCSLAFDKDINNYILIGEPALLSMWILPWIIKCIRPSCKIYFWSHGWYGRESIIKTILKKIFFKPANGLLLYGNYARQLMIDNGFDPAKLFVIHNSLDHKKHVSLRNELAVSDVFIKYFKNSNPVLVVIGRLTARKKLHLLFEAIYLLREKGENYNLLLIGDGEEKNTLEYIVKEYGLTECVWFYGACYDEKRNAELIYNSDMCVVPGDIGLTAIHTLSFGVPVLTHNCFKYQGPEFESIIEGKTGCFFEMDDIHSLCFSISKWFKEKSHLREDVRLSCYREVDKNWTPEYELNILKTILNE